MLGGRDHDDLLRRLEPDEKNRDTKRHIGYALDRAGQALHAAVATSIRQWNIENLGSASLNEPAPDFELASLDGQKVRLSQFRGKKSVVLVFVYGDT
ncbi:MAG: redoxin domain-containing protein [Planctomycetia bacterium]|nr:redoxin domain-containing protein [Planctomycetia bacterium]